MPKNLRDLCREVTFQKSLNQLVFFAILYPQPEWVWAHTYSSSTNRENPKLVFVICEQKVLGSFLDAH